jgi:hypothetical protein
MKRLPLNVWRTRLNDDDWNFSRCGSDELAFCINWELLREQAQLDSGGTLPVSPLTFEPEWVDLFRADFADHPNKTIREKNRQLAKVPKGWIYHPHFPQCSYLEHRKKENYRRLEKDEPESWVWVDVDWQKLFFRMWDELDEIARTSGRRIWLGGEDNVEIVPLSIPWSWRDEDIVKAFKEWLKERRLRGEEWDYDRPRVDEPPPRPKDKGGAGSAVRQVMAKLKALAAWRLIQHYEGNNWAAYEHPGASAYLGRQFHQPSAWSEARATVRRAMNANNLRDRLMRS